VSGNLSCAQRAETIRAGTRRAAIAGMSLRAARQAILALTVVVSVASAADASGPRPQPPVTVYDCDDLATITARRFADRLELSGTGQAPMILPQIGEDPVTFADATVTVTMNADYLRMTGPMGGPVCRRNVEEAPWQEARLRGIEFRATGSQPEWVLEYDEGSALTFVAGGFPSITATRLSVAVTSGDRMTITGSDGTREILVTIARAVCSGSSGVMTARVVVTTEGRAFSGCGRMLPSGKFRGTVNHDVRLPPLAVLSIRIVRIGRDAAQSRLVIATWKGPIGPDADASFEVDYNPSLLFGDDRFTIEACIQAGSQTRCNRRRPLVLTWGAFGSVTLSPEMFTDRSLTTLSASGERVFGSFVQKTSQPDSAAARMLTHPTCSARAA
jgi:hypothetical protein